MNHPELQIRFGRFVLIAAIAGLFSACAYRQPQMLYQPSGEIEQYKRYQRYPQRDFYHHFSRRAYKKPRTFLRFVSPDQRVIVDNWGYPDYERKTFRSFQDEKVDQWVYLDDRQIFQFVDDELIYEGPLTDLELIMIRYGYPDNTIRTWGEGREGERDVRTKMFYRDHFYTQRMESFYLTDDRIITAIEGN